MLRGASYARVREALRRGSIPPFRRADPDPRGPELRRGRGPRDRLRSAYGLHGGRADHAPGRTHGADGPARRDPVDIGDTRARRGVRAGTLAWAGRRERA